MGKVTGFLEIERHDRGYDKPEARLKHFIKVMPHDYRRALLELSSEKRAAAE